MAVFGRNTARQRLRRAAQESLKIPAFKSPADCTPWVTGGLWPAELSMVTAETAPLVKYLKADLQRIVNSANAELKNIRCAGLVDSTRRAEETRVINESRTFAVRRVESTVRQLHAMRSTAPIERRPVNGVDDTAKTARFRLAPPPDPEPTAEIPVADVPAPISPEPSEAPRRPAESSQPPQPLEPPPAVEPPEPVDQPSRWEPATDVAEFAPPAPESGHVEMPEPVAQPEPVELPSFFEPPEPSPPPEPVDQPSRWEPETDVAEYAPPAPEPFELTESVEPSEPVELPSFFEPPEPSPSPEPVELPESWELYEPVDQPSRWEPANDVLGPESEPEPDVTEPEQPELETPTPMYAFDSDDTEVLEDLSSLLREIAPLTQPPVEPPRIEAPPVQPPPVQPPPSPPAPAQPLETDDTEVTAYLPVTEPAGPAESERERLERLLKFVARQEPGLRWAVGARDDGSTVLVTDLAHGWIPPGLLLPADVRLLEPGRRTGNPTKLLGPTTLLATYAPGDPLGWATDCEVTDTSSQPRELPAVDDLGWVLGEATHWRDGLPRMVNTLAKAGAAGTGIVDAEIDILRVHLDTSRYQLLAQYPDVDPALLLNCLLLAATEAIATKNQVSANYHFAWFQLLSSPPATAWKAGP